MFPGYLQSVIVAFSLLREMCSFPELDVSCNMQAFTFARNHYDFDVNVDVGH
jgi:hypothetical protein